MVTKKKFASAGEVGRKTTQRATAGVEAILKSFEERRGTQKREDDRARAHQKWKDAKYKAWREQYPDEPYHGGWDRSYDIKGFEVDPFEKNVSGYVPPKKKAKGGSVSASKRADGIARKGKTKGRMV